MEHACDLAERIGSLLFDSKSSDLTLIVEGERLPVHRAIMASSCEYFRYLFVPIELRRVPQVRRGLANRIRDIQTRLGTRDVLI